MKVALLLSGEPRFCTHFDQFVSNIINYDSLEFFFYLWRKSPIEISDPRWNVVADFWRDIDEVKARDKILSNLNDPKYKIIDIKFGDRESFEVPIIEHKAGETNLLNVWQMYNAWSEVEKLKTNHEKNNDFKYDIVINGRFDIFLNKEIIIPNLHKHLHKHSHKKIVFTPNNPLHGYNGQKMNDCLSIANSDVMSEYLKVVNNILEYTNIGILFHPETLLGYHLSYCNIENRRIDFDLELRKGYEKKVFYTSDFGRWA